MCGIHPASVENHEQLVGHVPVHRVRLALLVAEERLQQRRELVDVEGLVPETSGESEFVFRINKTGKLGLAVAYVHTVVYSF